jgi:hypothetical protein
MDVKMNIKKAYEKFSAAEDEFGAAEDIVRERWERLLGCGCGHFETYIISGDTVIVDYDGPQGSGHGQDEIPIRFFDIPNHDKAVVAYKTFRKEQDKERQKKVDEARWDQEKRQYEILKAKIEKNPNKYYREK